MTTENRPKRLYTLREVSGESELRTFVLFHESVANWLWNRGIKQWQPGDFTVDTLRQLRENGGKAYIGWASGSPVGGFTLQWQDIEVWGEQELDAGYLHALWVSR